MAQYYMLNKPRGLLCARRDERRETVMSCFPAALREALHPVGRLDKDTEGLLLFTDDGMLDVCLLRPEQHVEKEYEFRAFGLLDADAVRQMETGVPLFGGKETSRPARAALLAHSTIGESAPYLPERYRTRCLKNPSRPVTVGKLWITEGRKHQVKMMVKAVGGHVFWLRRLAIGALRLDETLRPGEFRALTGEELRALRYERAEKGAADAETKTEPSSEREDAYSMEQRTTRPESGEELAQIPKIELHLHLDGAVPPQTMWQLAQAKQIPLPTQTPEQFGQWLLQTADCRDVNTYLARFELPLRMMQDAASITRITYDVLTTLARQGHLYDEIRFAPQLHTREGLRQSDAIEAVLAGREQALRAFPAYRCGILLCCMCVGPETVNMQQNLETVRLTAQYLGTGVVGMDLAGAEGIVPLRRFHPVFDLARELSLPFTCHAGDSQGADTVEDALDFGAKRIGHGHHIYDAPALWPRAIAGGVTLEICPTSNIQCKTQPSYAQHPAKKLLDAGLRVTISTDNMTLAATTLEEEYRRCVTQMGFTMADLRRMAGYALEAAFLPEEQKRELRGKI